MKTPFLVAALLLSVACTSQPEADALDVSTDSVGDSWTPDSTGCDHPRQFGDYGSGQQCWAPPDNYCSQGAGEAETTACNADNTACCHLPDTCQPCGWRSCAWLTESGEVAWVSEEGCPEPAEVTRLAGLSPLPAECGISREPFCP